MKAKVVKSLEAGFSLVELMIVVTIIGILSAVAVPKFQAFKARASQTESKSMLNGIFLSVASYEAAFNNIPDTGGVQNPAAGAGLAWDIGFSIVGSQPRYTYTFTSEAINRRWAAKSRSTARLLNNAFDTARINTNKWMCPMFDAVTNRAANPTPALFAGTTDRDCPQADTAAGATAVALGGGDSPN